MAPPEIWPPFTPAQDARDYPPLTIARARGVHLWDEQGRRYYDTISSWWTNLHGHGQSDLVKAVARQARQLDHVNFSGFTHRPAQDLVRALAVYLPPTLDRYFFSDNGSTAVEVALKIAFQYQQQTGQPQRTAFAYLDGAYHGDTLGTIGVSGVDDFHGLFRPLRFPGVRLPAPRVEGRTVTGNPVAAGFSDQAWAVFESRLRQHGPTLAAVVVEPLLQGVAGMQVYPAEFLQRLVRLCRELGILVIYDEVATGFGRTGSFLALDQTATVPDLLCLAKGLSGGLLPLALTVTSRPIHDAFGGDRDRAFYHGHSYTANPIACAAGVASLKLFRRQRLLDRLQAPSRLLADELLTWQTRPWVGDLRFIGLIGAVDVVNPATGRPFPAALRIGRQIYQRGLAAGLVLRPLGDTIYWLLPLVITVAQVRKILKLSLQTIEAVVATASSQAAADPTPERRGV